MVVLLVSDSPALSSGLARVTRELAQRFHDGGFNVAVAGWHDLLTSHEATFDYPVYPAEKQHPEQLALTLAHVKPDIVLAIGDPWDFAWLATHRRTVGGFTLVGYLNVEASPLPPQCEQILDGFDVVRTTSEYGARVVGRRDVSAVHHGVDTEVFAPMPRAAITMFGRRMDQTFVVFINAQNTIRKNLRTALAGFLRFAQGKPDVMCYVNSLARPGPNDPPGGADLAQLVVERGGENLVWFSSVNRGPAMAETEAQVVALYNMSAVLLSTSMAEGFGLTILEAMATGVVPIAPAAYSMPELFGRVNAPCDDGVARGRGFPIPVAAYMRTPEGLDHVVVSDEDVEEALGDAYGSWKDGTLRAVAESNLDYARTKTWDLTYAGIERALTPVDNYGAGTPSGRSRVADGGDISAYVRARGRQAAAQHPGAFGVLKLGGLGDMLQTTAVVRAAARASGCSAIVFCNSHGDVFRAMDEVKRVVEIPSMPQDMACRSLVDEFDGFLDVRYVSRGYGIFQTSAFGQQHAWMHDLWTGPILGGMLYPTGANARLATLKRHATQIMLDSLGLHGDIWPVYDQRQRPADLAMEEPAPQTVIATGVGTMAGLKKWPLERWTELVERLQARFPDQRIAQVGGKEDDLVPGIHMDYRGASLPETAYLLEVATRIIVVEGGIAHLTAATSALGRSVTVIYGPTSPVLFRYPGFFQASRTICPPCWQASPLWALGRCALGEPTCVNFPAADRVEALAVDDPNGVLVRAH